MKRVWVFPGDDGGCGHYRLFWPAQVLAQAGHQVEIFDPMTVNRAFPFFADPLSGQVLINKMPEIDVLVIQRPLRWAWAVLIPQLQRAGIEVVVDIDDDFHALDGRHPAFLPSLPRYSPLENRDHLMAAVQRASLVTVTTTRLAEVYGAHGRVQLLPNCVPEAYFTKRSPVRNRETNVGWAGWTVAHPGDLRAVGNGIARARRDVPFRVEVIGREDDNKAVSGQLGGVPVRTIPWVALHHYPAAVSRFDVGIVPLERNNFNEAKSWLKGLEMASVGVPFVATPTEPYRWLNRAGAGWLAETPAEWRAAVRELVTNEAARTELAESGLAAARELTLERNSHLWAEAWGLS